MNPGSTLLRLAFSMTGLDTGCNVVLPPFFFFYMWGMDLGEGEGVTLYIRCSTDVQA